MMRVEDDGRGCVHVLDDARAVHATYIYPPSNDPMTNRRASAQARIRAEAWLDGYRYAKGPPAQERAQG